MTPAQMNMVRVRLPGKGLIDFLLRIMITRLANGAYSIRGRASCPAENAPRSAFLDRDAAAGRGNIAIFGLSLEHCR